MLSVLLLSAAALAQSAPVEISVSPVPQPPAEEAAVAPVEAPPPAAVAFDIAGPEWASFGSSLSALQVNLAEATKTTDIGGRSCFTAERSVLSALWLVQVCSDTGDRTESVTLYLSRQTAEELSAIPDPSNLDPLYSKLRAALEGQYGEVMATIDGRDLWQDADGDVLSIEVTQYALAPGWKKVYGVPRFVEGGLASPQGGIIVQYRQAPGLR